MALPSSPYVIFRAKEGLPAAAQPIGLGHYLRIVPKKYYRKSVSSKNVGGDESSKKLLSTPVQLSFA